MDVPAVTTSRTAPTPTHVAAYREAAAAVVASWPPLTEIARRRLIDVTARSTRRRKSA